MLISRIEGSDILFAEGRRTILNDGRPAVFLPGWRAVMAYSGLPPITIVTFVNGSGEEGLWFLDARMERCGGTVRDIPSSMLADLMDGLCVLLDGIWRALMLEGRPSAPTVRQQAFFELPESCRQQLLGLYLDAFDAAPAYRRFDAPGSGALATPVLECGTRHLPLRLQGMHALFDPGLLQREQQRLLQGGALELPSPVDGRPLRCDKTLVPDSDLIAYRLHDHRWQLTSYVLAGDIFFRTLAVYIPEARLVLAADPELFEAQRPDLMASFFRHIALHGARIFAYLVSNRTRPLHVWRGRHALHLGHLLWNDLSGVANLVQSNPAGTLPQLLLCETGSGPEMYGPLDRIFPELTGRVLRRPEPFSALIESFYDMKACLFRSSGMRVTRDLRERILALVPVRTAGVPVVLLGLRTENRTLQDLPQFCWSLVSHMAATLGRVILVVDGHNRRADGSGTIWSHGELEASASPVGAEQDLVARMQAAARGTAVEIVSTIGAPVSDSLAWCRAANFFVSFWGAGLAKYRWVCNSPGLVLTSRWNLEHLDDLKIYSDPLTMDDPAEMVFLPADAVTDLPDSPLLVRPKPVADPSLSNFAIDMAAFLHLFDRMAESRLRVPAEAEEADATP